MYNDNKRDDEFIIVYYKSKFEIIQKNLTSFSCNSTYIYNENEIEIIIVDSTNKIRREYDYDDFRVKSLDYEYSIQTPSNELILSLVSLLSVNEISSINKYFLEREILYNSRFSQIEFFDFILQILRINCSIKVKSTVTKTSLDSFKKHIKSYLYDIAYNLNYLFNPIDSMSNVYLNKGSNKQRYLRLKPSEIIAPKLFYNDDLIERYNIALESKEPYIQFISYYQIIEYCFNKVSKEKMLNDTKEILQKPDFSYKNDDKVQALVKIVQKNTRMYEIEALGSELSDLKLVIEKYISKEDLITDINDFDDDLMQYYRTQKVSFSCGMQIDFDCNDNKNFIDTLSDRIYKTRNALVHNKSNYSEAIYHPSNENDKKSLNKEIPLMRIIAERIIFKTAKEI